MKRTVLSLICILTLLPAAHSCLNDRDSDALAEEARQLPDMVRILTGRFERNPPRYYEMRLARVTKELQKTPNQLDLYDDAAVAAERLHHSDAAIAWMAKKKARIGNDKEAIYRYHANLGTFLAHHWLGRKDRWNNLAEMQQARDQIARAVEIKPDAHFNRERYQLQVMEWLLTNPKKTLKPLSWSLHNDTDKVRQAQGLSGLIVLGAAWESVDITDALAGSLSDQGLGKLALIAQHRRDELLDAGRHSIMYPMESEGEGKTERSLLDSGAYGPYGAPTVPEGVKAKFTELRKEADAWQKERLAYMEARFAQGKHPDTDPNFWSEWKPAEPPSLDIPGEEEAKHEEARRSWWEHNGAWVAISVLMGVLALIITGITLLVRWLRRRFAR
ncbi:MAG: hypothetical protein QM758_17635 [Armatimonas sp.]